MHVIFPFSAREQERLYERTNHRIAGGRSFPGAEEIRQCWKMILQLKSWGRRLTAHGD